MSEKTDVVEVVADALYEALGPKRLIVIDPGDAPDVVFLDGEVDLADLARAALSAIPVTEEMVEAGARAACADLGVNPDDWSKEGAVRTYRWQLYASTVRAAIQAALKAAVEG